MATKAKHWATGSRGRKSYRPRPLDPALLLSSDGSATSGLAVRPAAGSVALSQREAWKRHAYLQDRYEFYLGTGRQVGEARVLANRDLVAKFGAATGYSAAQLEAILQSPEGDTPEE